MKTDERNMNEVTKDDFQKQRNEKQLDNLKYNINWNRKNVCFSLMVNIMKITFCYS